MKRTCAGRRLPWLVWLLLVSGACSTPEDGSAAQGDPDAGQTGLTDGGPSDAVALDSHVADGGGALADGTYLQDGTSSGGDAGQAGDGDAAGDGQGAVDWQAAFDHVFAETLVRPIEIDFEPGQWASMLADWRDKRLRSYRKVDVTFGADKLPGVGVRFRGYGALTAVEKQELPAKFPLKINFNKYGAPRYHHVDKVNLATNRDDLSLMRDRLTARLLQSFGVHAPRASYGTVRIDETDVGLYTLVQQVDKRYLHERFGAQAGADGGTLYKCIPGGDKGNICDLTWRGDKKSDYLVQSCPDGYPECGLVLKTHEDDPLQNDYKDLIALLDLLNHTPAADIEAALLAKVEVDAFLRFMAVNAALRNQDSMAYGKPNNYFLYRRPDTGRWMLLPYDFDMSYGGPNFADVVTEPLPVTDAFDNCMLSKRVMEVPAFHAKFLSYVKEVAQVWMHPDKQAGWVAEFDALLRPRIAADPLYTLESYDAAVGEGPSGLLGFVAKRRAFLLKADAPADKPCVLGQGGCGPGAWCKATGCGLKASGVCTKTPGACENIGGEVCGCDGKPYASACAASIAGVNVMYAGKCAPIETGKSCGGITGALCPVSWTCDRVGCALSSGGSCKSVPAGCPTPKPGTQECGCDGVSYDSACERLVAGVGKQGDGACP